MPDGTNKSSDVIKVALAGPAGSGKSFVAHFFADVLGFKQMDVGGLFRKRAAAKGLTIHEYDRLVEQNPSEDVEMDAEFKKCVESSGEDLIASWRMAFYFVPGMLSIWLDVDPKEAAERVLRDSTRQAEASSGDVAKLMALNAARMKAARQRLKKLYGVDFAEPANYGAVIDSTGLSKEEVIRKVVAAITKRYPRFRQKYGARLSTILVQLVPR